MAAWQHGSGTRGCREEEMVGLKNGWKQGNTVKRAKMSHMEITQKTPTENLTSNFLEKKDVKCHDDSCPTLKWY